MSTNCCSLCNFINCIVSLAPWPVEVQGYYVAPGRGSAEFVVRKLLKEKAVLHDHLSILICGDCDYYYRHITSVQIQQPDSNFVVYINWRLTILFLPPSCWWRIFVRLDCWSSINAFRFRWCYRWHSCWPHLRLSGCPGTDSSKFHIFWNTSTLLIPRIREHLALLERHPNVHHRHACEWPLRTHNHRGLCRPRNTQLPERQLPGLGHCDSDHRWDRLSWHGNWPSSDRLHLC